MRPDKLRAWLQRQRVGAVRLRLQHDNAGALQTFAEFPIDPPNPPPDEQAIYDACADYADSLEEQIRVSIQVLNDDGEVLAAITHKQSPLEAANEDAANAGEVSGNAIIAQLLRHIELQQRVMTGSQFQIHQAFERTMAQLQRSLDRAEARAQAMTELVHEMRARGGSGDEEDDGEVRVHRAVLYERLGALLPQVGEFMLEAAASRMGAAGKSNGSNGHYTPPPAGGG